MEMWMAVDGPGQTGLKISKPTQLVISHNNSLIEPMCSKVGPYHHQRSCKVCQIRLAGWTLKYTKTKAKTKTIGPQRRPRSDLQA